MRKSTSIQGIEIIKRLEGYSCGVYYCGGGHQTIGYGHKILKNEVFKGMVSLEQAEDMLKVDLLSCEMAILKYITVNLNNNQFDALVSFTFNLGSAALQRSTLRQKINYNQFQEASQEFLRWVYVQGRKLLGLINRRKFESQLFMS